MKENLNGTIHYRGFAGKVSYNPDDDLLYADCTVAGDMLVATGQDLPQLQDSFKQLIDDYVMLPWERT